MNTPFLIIGLGNPGKEYKGTRHDIGREITDAISQNGKLIMENEKWQPRPKLYSEIIEGTSVSGKHLVLARPTTYMNESGRTVAALARNYQLSIINYQLLIIHDDLDLPIGTLRLAKGGSSGGHKGVQSIIDALGAKNFLRLRIGIGPNEKPTGERIPAEKFVLEKFRKEEHLKINAAISRAVKTIEILLRDGLAAAQRLANRPM